MTFLEFRHALDRNPDAMMHWMLPDGSFVPAHYHVTEVGMLRKDFIDCGGTVRSTVACVLQIWVANDFAHRLPAAKLRAIIDVARSLLQSDDLPMEVEYDTGVISRYPVSGVACMPSGLLFHLDAKHTACLAPERCGVAGPDCC